LSVNEAKKFIEAEMQAAGIQVVESGIDFIFRPNSDEAKRAYTLDRA
jgi:flavorubredoxin